MKCLYWIKLMTGVDEIAADADSIDGSHDAFHHVLGDGIVLCKSVTTLSPLRRAIYTGKISVYPSLFCGEFSAF